MIALKYLRSSYRLSTPDASASLLHQVVVNLGRVDHNQLSAVCGQRGLNVLRAQAAEPVPMVDHDPRHRRVAQQGNELAAMPIHRRTDLGHDLVDRDLLGSGPRGYPPNLRT